MASMMDLPQTDDYLSLFLNDTPLLDVRAPVEFSQGAFPYSNNLPIMDDQEREDIGIRYKEYGQDEAIKLGHNLIQGAVKTTKVDRWENFFQANPKAILYCFRGGMRSKISQQWIYERTGKIFPRVKGGYKAMRRFLIDELEVSSNEIQPIMLGGRTGIGKTILLQKLNQQVDLEGLFHHRGSVFGKHVTPQPTQIDIENSLSIELLKHRNKQHTRLIFEDEGANIGSRRIPSVLFDAMQQAPLIQLEASIDERINITFQEYIIEALAEHQKFYGNVAGFIKWADQLQESIDKIQRRLGGVRYKELKELLTHAIQQHQSNNNLEFHKNWIEVLLVDYYDPMYDYQFSKKESRVIFKGSQEVILDYLKSHYQLS